MCTAVLVHQERLQFAQLSVFVCNGEGNPVLVALNGVGPNS